MEAACATYISFCEKNTLVPPHFAEIKKALAEIEEELLLSMAEACIQDRGGSLNDASKENTFSDKSRGTTSKEIIPPHCMIIE